MFTETPAPSVLRRATAVLDAFAAPHGIDRYVEQVAPRWSRTEVRGRIVGVDRSTGSTTVLEIEANRRWRPHRAGQHTLLTVEIDGVRHTRCYSIVTAAGAGRRIELAVKAHPDGLVSQHLMARARPGMVVGLSEPRGDVVLPDRRPDRLLLISGGSGITPAVSMLRTLCAEGHRGPVGFVHYARSAAEVPFLDEVRDLADRHPNVTLVLGLEDGTGTVAGLLDAEHLATADPCWADAEAFVCGPQPLMDAVRDRYAAAGAPERHHQEAFTAPRPPVEPGATGATVRFARSGVAVADDGRPLLEQAEAAGLAPAHGCRMGICHTCTRTLRCGTVRNAVTGELTSGTDVEIRICVNAPVGDTEIDL